jgi:hypothetical protein
MPSEGRVEKKGVEGQEGVVRMHPEQEKMDEYDLAFLEAKPTQL